MEAAEPRPSSREAPAPEPERAAPPRVSAAPPVARSPVGPAATPAFSLIDIEAPPGSDVWVDGVRIGAAPLHAVRLADGPHRLRLQGGGRSAEATVRVGGRRGSTRFTWDGGPQIGVH